MAISNMKATFQCEIQKVWNIVTSLDNYSWRSDLDRIEVIDENRFIEYTKEGYATTFTITNTEPCWRWEFDMDNDNMSGHWIGIFTYANGITTIDFTENVTAKKLMMKPFVKSYLKKQQSAYAADLEKAVSTL
ncbi:MAG: SRPBCC family protein [Clostridium sp.]|nr:SRPBCC family protein [Clostridium sp.]